MTTETEMQRKVVLALWNDGMEGTRAGDGSIRVSTDDGSEFQIIIARRR